jgi:CheY-like chemotaxis protein
MRKYRILVVDDNPDIVDTLGAILVLLGHAVETAHDGEQALAAMAVSTPDLVIMDVGMPGMSGYEVCQKAAAEPWRDRMTLVAMTGWGRDEDRQRAMDAGFDLHVVKPIDLERLRELLDSLQPPPAPLEGLANS